MTEKLRLSDVTLVAVDTAYHDLTERALRDSLDLVDFGAVLVLSDRAIGDWPLAHFDGTSARDAEQAVWYVVPDIVKTSHFLWLQWDSWVVDPAAWTNDFLRYDYVGAPWWHRDGLNVGNGGFSLRSTRLMRRLAELKNLCPFRQPEDDTLCRSHRIVLEREGFRWAPEELASRFSFERVRYGERGSDGDFRWTPTFGFHGLFNWGRVLDNNKLMERLAALPARLRGSPGAQQALVSQEDYRAPRSEPRVPVSLSSC